MSYSIKVTSVDNTICWESGITKAEFEILKPHIHPNTVNFMVATLKPVRTDNIKDFAKDFFLPTVVNHAIKIEGVVKKIFVALAALILDALTFPVRLLTVIPRIVLNKRQEEHVLKTFLRDRNAEQLLQCRCVEVQCSWETTEKIRLLDSRKKEFHRKYEISSGVNFIETPDGDAPDLPPRLNVFRVFDDKAVSRTIQVGGVEFPLL